MNRRLFFRSLVGAPAIAVAAPSDFVQAELVMMSPVTGRMCECGWEFLRYTAAPDKAGDRHAYMVCFNQRCPHYKRPLAIPTAPIFAANPNVVANVDASMRQQEQLRREHSAVSALQRGVDRGYPRTATQMLYSGKIDSSDWAAIIPPLIGPLI